MASELQQRKLAKTIIDQTIVAERGAFTFDVQKGISEVREVPFVYRPNLIAAIADTVNRHHKYILKKIIIINIFYARNLWLTIVLVLG